MNSSLNVLVKYLSDNNLSDSCQDFSGDLLKLVKQKGVYPYEYIDRCERLFEKQLPNRSKFYSSLKNE